MEINVEPHFTELRTLMPLLTSIWRVAENAEDKLVELKTTLSTASPRTTKEVQHFFTAAISAVLNRCTKNTSQDRKLKCLITDILKLFYSKTKIDSLEVFLFAYSFLLGEIYDHQQKSAVANIDEEYKLAITQSMTSLARALTWDAAKKLYTRENALSLCQMLYVIIQMAKEEQLRSLRLASIECIMALAKVDDTIEATDIEMRNQVADVFIFFAPGIISGLSTIAIEDEKRGHNIALLAIRAWGRIVAIQMQEYNAADNPTSALLINLEPQNVKRQSKWTNKEEVKEYLENTRRDAAFYKLGDSKLKDMMNSFKQLTHHSRSKIRLELVHCCCLLIEFCSTTIPDTISKVVEILIILSEDEDIEVSTASKATLLKFSKNFISGIYKTILENLEENFFAAVTALPRVFNGLDEQEQLSALNLLVGYLKLFGKTHMGQLLYSATHLKRLIQTLIHICELERKDVSLYEEYLIQDLELVADHRTPWKHFRHFQEDTVKVKLESVCALLAECDAIDMTTDLLLDIFLNYEENRMEATLILNNMLAGMSGTTKVLNNMHIIKNILNTYLDPEYWNLPLEVSHNCMMPQVQNNIVQICLQVEGIGKIALAMEIQFGQFLLKTLYPVMERAGSGHPLIKAAGIAAIANISVACGYANVTELINMNSDYFSFHVVHKMYKVEENESVLNVLATVMKYSNVDVLPSISDIVCGVLLQTCDKFFQEQAANAYIRLFQMFIKCLMRWFNTEICIQPIKSKAQKQMEHEPFLISNLNNNTDQDNIDAGKSAEEMFREDMEKQKVNEGCVEEEPTEEYEKPEPPSHIMLAVKLLQRSLNFLPSKDRARKLLVLEILKDGLEVIRDWDDELLPLVHQIWSPLVQRFKERDDLLVVNRSFELLATLARLSKDFIRSRTAKDVLPKISALLTELSRTSYLQDRGSAYRYTQAYKMQLNVVQQLARVITDLDLADTHINSTMETVIPYLSDKQPLPLQEAAISFFGDIATFDRSLVHSMIQKYWTGSHIEESEYRKNMEAVLQNMS